MLVNFWTEREMLFDPDYYTEIEANTRVAFEYNLAWRFYTFRLALKI